MFKGCCAKPNKKNNKSKPKTVTLNEMENTLSAEIIMAQNLTSDTNLNNDQGSNNVEVDSNINPPTEVLNLDLKERQYSSISDGDKCMKNSSSSVSPASNMLDSGNEKLNEEEKLESSTEDSFDQQNVIRHLSKKRYSVDYKRNRYDFKRYSMDCRNDSATLEELSRLEKELARTNIDARPSVRRKSVGILKSTSSFTEAFERRSSVKEESGSEDDDVFEAVEAGCEVEGPYDPPATPVGRDELALRRHRFFSDLVCAARAAVEHRVRFDPLGPVVADTESDLASAGVYVPGTELEALIDRLERVTSRLERLPVLHSTHTPPGSPEPPQHDPLPPDCPDLPPDMSVNGYQDLVQGPLKVYLNLSQQIGGDVASHAQLVNAAFQAQLRYIQLSASRGKPSQNEEKSLLAPTSEQISAIQQFREKNRVSPYFNHLSAISESIPALGWVAVAPTPGPYVKEMNDAGQFYSNRVLKEWKEKDKRHAEWCRAWVQLLTELQAYVKQYHTTGLVWTGTGSGAGGPPPPPPGGMPPPPPCMPLSDFDDLSLEDRNALFAQINQGEGITNSLRKVTSDMQTHKNPQLRQGPAPFKAAPASGPLRKQLPTPGAGVLPDKPPVFVRDGKKWLVEYQKGNQGLVVENADMNNVVYMFRCRDSSLTVRGKINGVVLDSCTKCAVVFDNLVSSIEFVNCQSVQMQVLGKVPTVSVDKTDGCQIYLSPQSLDVEIVSSKSSEMNVLVPNGSGDYSEHPIPEQFKTMLNKGRSGLVTTSVENKG